MIFFQKYNSTNNNIYKIGSSYIVQKFLELDDKYEDYLANQENEEKWKNFWLKLDEFYHIIKNEYWDNLQVVYGKFRWERYLSPKSVFAKVWYSIVKVFYDTSIALTVCLSWVLYLSLASLIFPNIPDKDMIKSLSSSVLILWLYSFIFLAVAIIFNINRLSLTRNEQSIGQKLERLVFRAFSKFANRVFKSIAPKTSERYFTWKNNRRKKIIVDIPELPVNRTNKRARA